MGGAVLLGYYALYASYLILNAMQHDLLPAFSWIMMVFTLPLTILTFGIVVVREGRLRVKPLLFQGDITP